MGILVFGRVSLCFLLILSAGLLSAQETNQALNGTYHFVQLLASLRSPGVTENVYTLSGTIVFDGAGSFTFSGNLGEGSAAPTPLSGSGAYSVALTGSVSLDNMNPNAAHTKIDARLGDEGEILLGSTSQAADGAIDFFVAVQAPTAADNSVLGGEYTAGSLGFLNASQTGLTSTLLTFMADGQGIIPRVGVLGHAADILEDENFPEEILNVPYTIHADGAGTATFGSGFGDGSGLFFGVHDLFVSANGNYVIGASRDPRAREVFVAIRDFSNDADSQVWSGDYWIAAMVIDTAVSTPVFTSYNGALRAMAVEEQGAVVLSERAREISEETGAGGATFNVNRSERFRIDSNSRGSLGSPGDANHVNLAVGAAQGGRANAFVAVEVGKPAETSQRHGILFGVRAPTLSGPGVFVHPLGVVNGASFAAPPFAIAPGAIVALFGTNLAPAGTAAQAAAPLPTSLAGVSVLVNDAPAPLYSVTPEQINFQLPFTVNDSPARIAVSNNGSLSNPVEVEVAASSPGVFTANGGGSGPGAVTHSDFRVVTRENPAARGEWISIYLTGLGVVSPAVPEGMASPLSPLSEVVDRDGVRVLFNGKPAAEIGYVGLAPGFVGLYQINVRIPADDSSLAGTVSLEIETPEARSSLCTLEIAGLESADR